MNATELMIGDWVFTRGENVQVTLLYDGYISTEHHSDSHDYYFNPIPLTPKILEKNGWEKSIGENPVEVWAIGKGTYLHKTDNGYKLREGAEFNVPNIQYVHTLQHALRLCGLNDLADNFKV